MCIIMMFCCTYFPITKMFGFCSGWEQQECDSQGRGERPCQTLDCRSEAWPCTWRQCFLKYNRLNLQLFVQSLGNIFTGYHSRTNTAEHYHSHHFILFRFIHVIYTNHLLLLLMMIILSLYVRKDKAYTLSLRPLNIEHKDVHHSLNVALSVSLYFMQYTLHHQIVINGQQ